jgi:hypothetical protein
MQFASQKIVPSTVAYFGSAEKQHDKPRLSEAIRQLVKLGLKVKK